MRPPSILRNPLRKIMLPLEDMHKNLPKTGTIYDLGCGEGIISIYLSKNIRRKIVGIDSNTKRLAKSYPYNVSFKSADISKTNISKASGIVISDVLHHINPDSQKKILKKIYKSLNAGGVLIIKEIDKQEFFRSTLSRFWDFIFYPKDKIYYWDADYLKSYLKETGFKVIIRRTNRFFPGSTTLFICSK